MRTRSPAPCAGVMSRESECDLSQEESMEVDCNHCVFEDSSELGDLDAVDAKDMRLEAQAVVNDVLFAVREMHVAHSLQNAVDVAHINVETREGNRYCLELTEAGLRVVGYAFDQVDESMMTQYHETVYSLLDSLSPAYREAFGNALLQRLERLNQNGR
ncbi:GSK3-beta interaction protein-like [Polyodon spathula]|nr:GSK3-beta interaction protein-like [Polyodon spathula]